MSIAINDVQELFVLYSGVETALPYLPIILGAIAETEALLIASVGHDDSRILSLCAALANLRYVQATAARDGLSHTFAGGVTENRNSTEKYRMARSLYEAALDACHGLIVDWRFEFIRSGEAS